MVKRAHDVRLQAKALKFATLRAQGMNQTEAWRTIFPNSQQTGKESEYVAASRFANNPIVKAKVAEVLQNAATNAMVTASRYIADTQDLRDWCIASDNQNAAVAAQRLIGQAAAVLQDRGSLTVEHRVEAEKLREQLKSLGMPADQVDSFVVKTSFGDTKH